MGFAGDRGRGEKICAPGGGGGLLCRIESHSPGTRFEFTHIG